MDKLSLAERIANRARKRQAREERAKRREFRELRAKRNALAEAAQGQGTPFIDAQTNKPLFLGNLYRGASAFIILSGPSVLDLDLSLLRRRGIITIGVNNSPATFRPNIWTHVDPLLKFHDAIWKDPAILKFVNRNKLDHSIRIKKPDGRFLTITRKAENGQVEPVCARDMPGVIGDCRNAYFNPETWLSEPTINWGNSKRSWGKNKQPRILNVMLAAVKLAYSLGFRIVYLLGCDFNMQEHRPYSFSEAKGATPIASNNEKYSLLCDYFSVLKPHFDAAGYRVFNCNPDSGLTIFPFVGYIEAIESATAHVPQDPLDTAGWYLKVDRVPAA